MEEDKLTTSVPVMVGPEQVGCMLPEFVDILSREVLPFISISSTLGIKCEVALFPNGPTSPDERSSLMADLLQEWRSKKLFVALAGWRNELYPVWKQSVVTLTERSQHRPHFYIERSAAAIFGFRSFGCHLNGYFYLPHSKREPSDMRIWIARRSASKQTHPLMLDNVVGGGLPSNISPFENMCKEAMEEAKIHTELMRNAREAGSVSFKRVSSCGRGITVETDFVWDLELSPAFVPTPADGEVEEFLQFDAREVQTRLSNGEFAPAPGHVATDF
eukprot:Partr_v1_DN24010_c1_g1_i2_m34782 putative thiamin pyrophosphokinase-related protein